MKTKIEEIYENVLPEMARLEIEDTTENRIIFLTGLKDAWIEDTSDDCFEKTLWVLAVIGEIAVLTYRANSPFS